LTENNNIVAKLDDTLSPGSPFQLFGVKIFQQKDGSQISCLPAIASNSNVVDEYNRSVPVICPSDISNNTACPLPIVNTIGAKPLFFNFLKADTSPVVNRGVPNRDSNRESGTPITQLFQTMQQAELFPVDFVSKPH